MKPCLWYLLLFLSLRSADASAACAARHRATVTLDVVGTVILAPVRVNGLEGTFILDTGAAATSVTPEAVERFGLSLDEWTATTMRGVGGIERRRNANPRSVELGGIALRRRSLAGDSTLRVGSMPKDAVSGRLIDGLLGRDFLSAFDLNLNLAARALRLYEVTGCAGRPPPGTEGYDALPVENPADSALVVLLEVDGVRLRALLDSGASQSLVAAPGMARLALGLDRLGTDISHTVSGMGPHTVTMWQHKFRSLRVGGETIADPVFLVAPIQLNPVSDMLLGADWLVGRQVWISYATKQVYVSK